MTTKLNVQHYVSVYGNGSYAHWYRQFIAREGLETGAFYAEDRYSAPEQLPREPDKVGYLGGFLNPWSWEGLCASQAHRLRVTDNPAAELFRAQWWEGIAK